VKASIESKIAQRIPSLDLRRNYARIEKEIKEAIDGVLASQAFILGPEVEAFEEEAAMYLEVPHAVGCSSGSDALLGSYGLGRRRGRRGYNDALFFFRYSQLHRKAGG